MTYTKTIKKLLIGLVSLLGALGNSLQNYMAVLDLLKTLVHGTAVLSKISNGILHLLAVSIGSVCSSFVNLCINIELLESFLERITTKTRPNLQGWQKFQYWFGSGIFIITGILFGLTAFAFGPIGALAAISIAAGIFVAIIMMIQELETWLDSFDHEDDKKKSLLEIFNEWYASLSKGKLIGHIIAIGNVMALSLLFTLGLANFLIGIGVALLPALITGFVIAFTVGAFTEFYFYNKFLAVFCHNLPENLHRFWQAKYSPLGLVMSAVNGLVNGVLSYVGIQIVAGLLLMAGMTMPTLPIIILAATAAVFAGLASFILGLDFWQRNSARLFTFDSEKVQTSPTPYQTSSAATAIYKKLADSDLQPDLNTLAANDPPFFKTQSIFSSPAKPLASSKTQAKEDACCFPWHSLLG